jgi:hypothetical protein
VGGAIWGILVISIWILVMVVPFIMVLYQRVIVRGAVDFPTLKSLVERTRKTGFSKLL